MGGWSESPAVALVTGGSDFAAAASGRLLPARLRDGRTYGRSPMRSSPVAVAAGIFTGLATFALLAPTQCETHYMRFVPGGWDTETVSTSCRGIAAFHYGESKELVGPRQPEGGTLPRPSLFQPQAVITAVVIAGIVAFHVWLVADRPRVPGPARWLLALLLLLASLVSAIDPGGLVIYAAPILVPLFWWISTQGGVFVRAFSALVAGFLSVEAVALFSYGTSNAVVAPLVLMVGGAVATLVLFAPRVHRKRGPQFPNL